MKYKMIRIVLILLSFIISLSFVMYFFIIRPQKKTLETVRAMDIKSISGEMVKDGTYRGNFKYGSTGVAVLVNVRDHRIKQIEILKGGINEYGLRAESIVDSVIQANSTQVDVITGSTTTSKALLKAIENALMTAQ